MHLHFLAENALESLGCLRLTQVRDGAFLQMDHVRNRSGPLDGIRHWIQFHRPIEDHCLQFRDLGP